MQERSTPLFAMAGRSRKAVRSVITFALIIVAGTSSVLPLPSSSVAAQDDDRMMQHHRILLQRAAEMYRAGNTAASFEELRAAFESCPKCNVVEGGSNSSLLQTLESFAGNPDRVFLRMKILPALANAGVRDILSIGVHIYTIHLEYWWKHLQPQGTWSTVEIDKGTSDICGASDMRKRCTADVLHMVDKCPATMRHFDAVLLNGVIGFGVNTEEDIQRLLLQVDAVTRPGASIVVGWNMRYAHLCCDTKQFLPRFQPQPLSTTMTRRTTFTSVDSDHVFDTFRKIAT